MSSDERRIPVLTLPRTMPAVRAALTEDELRRFAEEMKTGDVIETFGRWWNIAAMRTSPAVAAAVERYRAGASALPIEDVAATLRRSA